MNILIIDDNKIIVDVMKSILNYISNDYNIFIDMVGDLHGINLNEIDAVISDINLIGYDGRKVLKKIKTKHPNIRTILMSGALLDDDFKEMKKYKVDYILTKPFRHKAIKRILS